MATPRREKPKEEEDSHLEIESTLNQKPSIILFYNKAKKGVDTLNKIIRSYSTKRMTRIWPLVIFYNTIDVSTINALIIWQGINDANGNIRMRQQRTFLIRLGKELCGITKKAQPVALIFATRKRNVTLAANDVFYLTERRTKNVHRFCCKCGKHVCPENSDIVCNNFA